MLALAAASLANAQSVQIVSGRVLADSTHPLAGAIVSVTMAPDRLFKQDTTDAEGRWRVRFERSSGDYLVHIAATGRVSFRKRVTASTTDSVVTVDATLAASVQQLAAVNVQATRPKPTREGDVYLPDGVSAEYLPAGVNGAVAADQQGDLAALAATIPGLSLTASGVSAFGLDPSQNGVTLNGLSFPGAALPRNATTSTRFSTSTYDPSRGGFAGVETAVTLSPGSINTHRRANVTLDAPQLQATDRISRQLGQRVTGGQGSYGGSGSLVEDVWYYNVSGDISRRTADAPSLVNADASLFPLAGVTPDSVTRLLSALASLGIPTAVGRDAQRINDDGSFAFRLDHAPYKPQSFIPNTKTWALVGLGRVQRSDAQNASLTATPAHGSRSERELGVLQLLYSTFVKDYSLSETRSGLSLSRSRGSPYLQLPDGSVLVSSSLPDGSLGASSLAFGGNARSETDAMQWSWETRTDYQWFSRAAHRLKVTVQSKVDGYHEQSAGNMLGSFGFASLADLAANRPSSFSRSLAEPDRDGALWSGFASLGDQWRVSPTLQLVYGARVEANRFLVRPAYNAALDGALGVRTDAAPAHVHVSPRLGFSWRYGGERAGYRGFSFSNVGSRILSPTGLLRGGIGEFRATMPSQLLSEPSVFTGLPGGARRISCIGDAVPLPNWSAYANDPTLIPTSCLVAPSVPTLSDAAPAVQTIDPSFEAPRSWRANLGWLSVVKNVGVSVDGSIAINLNQRSAVDLNFSGVPQFVLADEGRAVFTSASAIVPATGLLSSVEARSNSAFGSVVSRRSDLRSLSRQLTITVAPNAGFSSRMLDIAYTLSSTRGDVRGFDGGAFGDPRTIERGRTALDVRHRIQLQAGKTLPRGFSATLFLTAASGLPYTPVVNGDVNGDGIARDRAFVTDPGHASDLALATGMRQLLASASPQARRCLVAQLGHAASINSCEGPWSATATARIGIANAYGPWGRRVNASLSISNPLAGVDQALHGENGLHGWGTMVFPDPVLLTVRGFDPATSRFKYDVNPRFGSTSPSQTTVRAPFRATLDVAFDLSPSTARQQLERVLNRGRKGHAGARLSADSIRRRFARNVRSPYESIIDEADSLLLSREQVERLRTGDAAYQVRVDSIWTALGKELALLDDDYNAATATQKTEDATDRAWEVARDEVAAIKEILSPLQFSLAPGVVQYLATVKGRIMIRYYMY
jgi:hypothetical protein